MDSLYPDYFARFYDIIYHHLHDGADNQFFLKKIAGIKGKVLDIGVGTGRFFIKALENNADIYGIDISPAMIDILKQKLNAMNHHRISVQNMITFKTDHKFDLIVAPFRVFMHLLSIEEQLVALNNINEHLTDEGLFIFDVFFPDINLVINGIKNQIDFQGEYEPGKKLTRTVWANYDLINQLADITMRFTWDENRREISKDWHVQLRLLFRYEIEHLIARSDLKLEKIYGNYHEQELKPESREIIVICRKGNI